MTDLIHLDLISVHLSLLGFPLLFHFFSIIPVHYSSRPNTSSSSSCSLFFQIDYLHSSLFPPTRPATHDHATLRMSTASMEGSESETVFDSLKLNPQLFVNEILNSVDDIVDGAFECYLREASNILHVTDDAESAALKKGVAAIKDTIQDPLEKRLQKWADYCLGNCFSVPIGFVLPKEGSSASNSMHQDELTDIDLDAQIGSLREKLSLAAKESAEIHKELFALEKHTAYSTSCIEAASTVVQPLQEDKAELFQELLNAASELGNRVEKLQDQTEEELKCIRNEQICNFDINRSSMLINGLPSTQDKLLQFVDSMKKCDAQPLL